MAQLLSKINGPKDIKGLSAQQLIDLSNEIREYILHVVAKNGGHLAPNLGVVELTVALHRVFDVPFDKMIWDVGHQTYAHKILTGRRKQFEGLRQYQGISGFPRREESIYDCFNTGHGSTSISAALGMAKARDLDKEDYHVIAVIGDGALGGGMAYEALNNTGASGSRLIIVLNDNEMSIDQSVGAMAEHLLHLRTDPRYARAKVNVESLLNRMPTAGPVLSKALNKTKNLLKYFLVPGVLFEEMGFTYLGPIDGHNIEDLINIFQRAKTINRPVLIHVLTQKGKGYLPAEKNPNLFHGVGAFDLRTGELSNNKGRTYTDIFGEELCVMASKDKSIVAITAAMADGTGLLDYSNRFGDRFFDVGIAEQHGVTFAAALAAAGKKPIVAIYSTFLQRAYDQILHDVCIPKLPVIFAVDRAGIVGEDGTTHQGLFDLAYLRQMPNMIVMAPKDGAELRKMLRAALALAAPVAIRYPKACLPQSFDDDEPIQLGKAEVLRQGDDLTIAACGSMVAVASQAADILAEQAIRANVINVRFIAPLDVETISRLTENSGRLLCVEEGSIAGGFGSACLEDIKDYNFDIDIAALPKQFITHGKREMLLEKYGLTATAIAERVKLRWFGGENG